MVERESGTHDGGSGRWSPRPECREKSAGTVSLSDELVRRPYARSQCAVEHGDDGKLGSVGMNVQKQIDRYIADQVQPKRGELQDLHRRIIETSPDNCKLWFLDGRNSAGKIVSNPNIGYGSTKIKYANGEQREFYRVGLSANTTGISVYVMGLNDKRYLLETYGSRLGKAKITGYCVKFRSIKDVNIDTLEEIIADAMDAWPARGS
jgi:hypothetical protein